MPSRQLLKPLLFKPIPDTFIKNIWICKKIKSQETKSQSFQNPFLFKIFCLFLRKKYIYTKIALILFSILPIRFIIMRNVTICAFTDKEVM